MSLVRLCVLTLALPACQKQQRPSISYGCGGGFSGGSEVTTLLPDGKVIRCRRDSAQEAQECETQTTELDSHIAHFLEVHRLMDEANFESLAPGTRGNWGCTITRGAKSVNVGKSIANPALDAVVKAFTQGR